MKQLVMFGLSLALVAQVSAQKWVKTTQEKKVAVLEEFTGLRCGYCPDGHRIGSQLAKDNPGKVILVNIHSGYLSVPTTSPANQYDFRTPQGDSLDKAAGVTGYPSGSVGRINRPWGKSRSTWAADVTNVMGQNSPVNLAAKATIDHKTRELIVEVEGYYTSDVSVGNYLTVYLLQDEFYAYQSDYGNFNPTNWFGGLYNHSHFLRMVLSNSVFGDKIDDTKKDSYIYRKYVKTLPAKINDIELDISKLEVVAFINEQAGNIYSGTQAKVELDAAIKTDLSITDVSTAPADLCVTTVNPKVEVTNTTDNDVTSFEITANINSQNIVKSFSGKLAKGEKTTIDFGSVAVSPTGTLTYSVKGFTKINNGDLLDVSSSNNSLVYSGLAFKKGALTSVAAGFETALPAHYVLDKSQNTAMSAITYTSGDCGAKNTKAALRFPIHANWKMEGKKGSVYFGEVSLSALTNPYFSFYYAYSDDVYGGTKPLIEVEISDDCGANWTKLTSFSATETGKPTVSGNYYVPKSSEYIWVGIPLDNYKGKGVIMRVSGTPGTTGNSMYFDEMAIKEASSVNEINKYDPQLSIYPNPTAQNGATLNFTTIGNQKTSVSIVNSLGQTISQVMPSKLMTTGTHTLTIPTQGLASGIYMVQLNLDGVIYSTRLSITE